MNTSRAAMERVMNKNITVHTESILTHGAKVNLEREGNTFLKVKYSLAR